MIDSLMMYRLFELTNEARTIWLEKKFIDSRGSYLSLENN